MIETLDPDRFFFRGLDPKVYLGTASDRYSGWIGQVYSRERYAGRLSTRTHKVGGKSFKETVLPVDSLDEYFQHFRVLEIDYTFYGLLLDETGHPTPTHAVLSAYAAHLRPGDRVILKAPQLVTARKLRRGSSHVANGNYLDTDLFTRRFYEPARTLLGDRLTAIVFEQEYQREAERISPRELAEGLDAFFASIEPNGLFHVELRTETYLVPEIFEVYERHGVGQVLSHWTWLPSLVRQAGLSGRVFNSLGRRVIRLMTPRKVRYEDAYAKAYPFDALVEGMLQKQMVEDVLNLVKRDTHDGNELYIIVNNRSGGNAPLIAKEIARSLLAFRSEAGR